MQSPVWHMLASEQDPELQRLAKALPNTVLAGRADSTTKKYIGAFSRWKQWASRKDIRSFPVCAHKFVLYLQHVGEATKSRAAVEEAVNAIAWMQRLAGEEVTVAQDPLVKLVVDGFQRLLARPKVRKEPVTADMLPQIVESMQQPYILSEVRLAF